MFHHDKDVSWVKIEGETLENAKELEDFLCKDLSGENSNPTIGDMNPPSELVEWLCAHCLDLPSQSGPRELWDVKVHVHAKLVSVCFSPIEISLTQGRHNILDPELNRDYYKDFEAPQGYRTDVMSKMAIVHVEVPQPTEPLQNDE